MCWGVPGGAGWGESAAVTRLCTSDRQFKEKCKERTWGRSSIVDVEGRSKNPKGKGSYSERHLESSISKPKHLKALGSIRCNIIANTPRFLNHLTQISKTVMQQASH